ncbi:hypothetical protein CHCC14527_3366 [Bacillus paralicheniformis]|nr:hypothetical protein CHCC15332_1706 [Bacillus paralicheniformis]TWN38895.1 hypothetical protein CHCC14527_3366 [Bacillus paralicheniformis]TWN69015.1 hypothetical protein CHCC14427_1646 [Bacillus paralicheniformis]
MVLFFFGKSAKNVQHCPSLQVYLTLKLTSAQNLVRVCTFILQDTLPVIID